MKPSDRVNYFVGNKTSMSNPPPTQTNQNKNNLTFKAQGNKSFFNFTPKKIAIALLIIILGAALPLTLGLLRNRQDIRQRAAASTVLTVSAPSDQISNACGTVNFTVNIDPGTNAVTVVELFINFDPNVMELTSFDPNQNVFKDITNAPNIGSGSASISLSVGDNPTNAVQSPTAVTNLVFNILGTSQSSTVSIDESQTKIFSILNNEPTENVLSSVVNSSVEIIDSNVCNVTPTPTGSISPSPSPTPTDAACPPPGLVSNVLVEYPYCNSPANCLFTKAICSWENLSAATGGYFIKVNQVESGDVVLEESVSAQTTQVIFDIVQDKTYKCEVSGINTCGTGLANSHSLLCTAPGQFPTNTPQPTPTIPACQLPNPVTNLRISCPTCDLTTRP